MLIDNGTQGQWRRSTRCSTGACTAVRLAAGVVEVADSKLDESPVLRFGPGAWRQFVAAIRDGEFRS